MIATSDIPSNYLKRFEDYLNPLHSSFSPVYSTGPLPVFLPAMSLNNMFTESVKTFDLRDFITHHWSSVMGERDWRPFVYGGLASCTAEFGTFPIDTTKTRLQIQGQVTDERYSKLRYRGMTDALVKISKQEGISALYSGISPAVLRQATYGTIKFGSYYSLKELFGECNEENVGTNVGCAVVAGIISSSIANPTDVLKVRMQIIGTGNRRGLFSCFRDVYKQEGVAGLWRGVVPTSQRAAVIAAVELPVYDSCKQYLIPVCGDTVTNHFVSSFIASLGSAIASTPLDVVRTRLMNQRKFLSDDSKVRVYRGALDCMIKTVKSEGPMALYKGFVPTWLRMGPWNIIFFITYEKLKKLY